jgi:hypothetical protein
MEAEISSEKNVTPSSQTNVPLRGVTFLRHTPEHRHIQSHRRGNLWYRMDLAGSWSDPVAGRSEHRSETAIHEREVAELLSASK